MGKMYTLDNKLLTEIPEIRVGDKLYAVDNRVKTVEKIQSASEQVKDSPYEGMQTVLELALGKKAAKEIDELNMPHPAYQRLVELVMAAVTGEDPEETADRFPKAE